MIQENLRGVLAIVVAMTLTSISAADALAKGDGGDPAPVGPYIPRYFEDGNLIRAGESIPALGPDLMGDSVNEYSGTLSFTQTDASLPGNNALPVAVGRHLDVGVKQPTTLGGLFGDWDIEIPHLHTLAANVNAPGAGGVGWYGKAPGASTYNQSRCSQMAQPPDARRLPGPSAAVVSPMAWWGGYHLNVPGSGDQTLNGRFDSTGLGSILPSPIQPTDGVPYPVLTKDRWQLSCLPSLANGTGEGFLAVSPEGTRYQFDHLAVRPAVGYMPPSDESTTYVLRSEIWIMPSLVTDRFGNWVRYTYGGDGWAILSITSSDGRSIVFDYVPGTHRVRAIGDGTRVWTYGYAADGSLQTVTQPDAAMWSFALRDLQRDFFYPANPSCNLQDLNQVDPDVHSGSIGHPSGAVGSFTLRMAWHGRSNTPGTPAACPPSQSINWVSKYFSTYALNSKTLSGPGMPPMTWSYSYSAPNGSWAPCNNCVNTTAVIITDPQGDITRRIYGTQFGIDEGLLMQEEIGWTGNGALRTTTIGYAQSGPFPPYVGYAFGGPSDWAGGVVRPRSAQTIVQQDVSFSNSVAQFDGYARPVAVNRNSSLGFSRTDTVGYYDDTTRWVLDQTAAIATNGIESSRTSFDPATDLPAASYAFNADGTLATQTDGSGHTTRYANFVRGLPQDIGYADGTSVHGLVDNLGHVTAYTNEAGTQWIYGYDAMGRLASETPPAGDAVAYNARNLSFVQVPYAEAGIEANHWRQTITQGNAVTVNHFDARWRKRLTTTYDAADPGGTQRTRSFRFDAYNRATFASYPARSIGDINAAVPGIATVYDALGRPTQSMADSELGTLSTTTQYLSAFQKLVTNPRGFSSRFAYQVFDQPSESALIAMTAPEGVQLDIRRDVFGKAIDIHRSGSYDGKPVIADRIYVYDANQLLCKTLDNEVGATVQALDGANNIVWRATGLPLGDQANCNQGDVTGGSKVAYAYDARNRLIGTGFGDGSTSIGRSFTPDGLPLTTVSGGVAWTYSYNNRRLLTQERLSVENRVWTIGRGYDANGNMTALGYPDGAVLGYGRNALGEANGIPGYATGITRQADGSVGGFTYANGIRHGRSQNVRGLPLQSIDSGVLNDSYRHDENGNVTGIDDQLENVATREMGYDGQDRLTAANSPAVWGAGAFSYDPLDNLRVSIIGGRSSQHNYDISNRLETINTNGVFTGYGYDARGNIIRRGTRAYYFDFGNRLMASSYVEHYAYDGLGRRTVIYRDDGSVKLQMYSQSGELLFGQLQTNAGTTTNTRYVYLDGKLIAEATPSATTFQHTDALGSPVARTDAAGNIVSRTRYEPYGNTAAGTNPDGPGFTGHVNDLGTGLIYMQQRYYDPLAGRFQSVDPVLTDAHTGAAFNRYNYANNNPYRYTDPDGRFSLGEFGSSIANWWRVSVDAIKSDTFSHAAGQALDAAGPGLGVVAKVEGAIAAKTVESLAAKATVREITLSRSIQGEAATHAADAINAGKPSILTIDRVGAAANRQASIGRLDKVANKHLDEYPPAMFREGGTGASVRPINARDNMSAGACVGNACRGLPDGARIQIKIGD